MSAKRKASAASPTTLDLRPNKKQKTPNKNKNEAEQATAIGLRFIEQLRKASDKNGRHIATVFLELPDKDELPDYYDIIKLAVSVDMIEEKLNNRQYPSLSAVEGDVKRMVQNAKDYNEPSSEVYSDAERIRKNLHNFMKANNPAYKDPEYRALPTPIPEGTSSGPRIRLNTSTKATPGDTPSRPPTKPAAPAAAVEEPPDTEMTEADSAQPTALEGGEVYDGLSFQAAQEKLIQEMMDHVNEYGEQDFVAIFGNLPSRSMEDYYRAIKEPQSLKKVLKSIRGWKSRQEITGTTEFKTWDALEHEVGKVWRNAMAYNEDGSDIFKAAQQLQEFFELRLAEAKKRVREPVSGVKLKTGATGGAAKSGLKLNLSTSQKQSPAPAVPTKTASPTPATAQTGVTVDQAALQRQQAEVKSAVSQASQTAPTASSVPNLLPGPQGLPPAVSNGVTSTTNTAVPGIRPSSSSNSPFPAPLAVAAAQPPTQMMSTFDNKWRQEGREALIKALHLTTPEVPGTKTFKYSMTTHAKLAQQSVTLNLPISATLLQVRLDLSAALQGTFGRPSKIFATVNGMRVPQKPESTGMSNRVGSSTKTPAPAFDLRLVPGMNRIEVECAAVGQPRNGNLRGELEMERFYVFANVLKG